MTGGIRYTAVSGGRKVLVEQLRLAAVLGITGCVLIALETTWLSRLPLPILGFQTASPALGLLFCMAVGFLYGEREGGILGLVCGWLTDAAGSASILLLPLVYFLCGYASGTVGKRRLAHNWPSFSIFALCGGGLFCLFSIARVTVSAGAIPPLSWIWQGTVPVWLSTVVVSPLVYGLVRGEQKLLQAKS